MPEDAPADAPAAGDGDAVASEVAADAAPRVTGRDLLTAGIYAAVVLVLAASGIANSGFLGDGGVWPREVSAALLLVACASLVLRRRRPVVPFAVAGPIAAAEIIGGGQISAYFLLFEALFVPVMHGSRRIARICTVLAIGAGAAAVLAALLSGLPGPVVFLAAMISGLMVSTPLLWGWEVRHHREARRAAERLAGLEHELAESRAARAVEVERRSIAHDLHDVIAGHLSAVALHSSLAASLEDPAARESSLATSRSSAQAALRDLRSMIGVLSEAPSGPLPSPTLDWSALAARLRGRDPSAEVLIDPALADPTRVGPSVRAALLRIGAEAVTNAVRHGRAPMRLAVRADEDAVVLEVVNGVADTVRDGAEEDTAVGADEPGTGSGLGRTALVHRALALGGSARSGPVTGADGAPRWQVTATLPAHGPGDPGGGTALPRPGAALPSPGAALPVTGGPASPAPGPSRGHRPTPSPSPSPTEVTPR
jgi:signal transduction histidine kinase